MGQGLRVKVQPPKCIRAFWFDTTERVSCQITVHTTHSYHLPYSCGVVTGWPHHAMYMRKQNEECRLLRKRQSDLVAKQPRRHQCRHRHQDRCQCPCRHRVADVIAHHLPAPDNVCELLLHAALHILLPCSHFRHWPAVSS